jgi:hypothetical protein
VTQTVRIYAYSLGKAKRLQFHSTRPKHTSPTMLAAVIVMLLLVVLVATESDVSRDGQN